ncbi:hypothetical protein NYE40_23600 [Paenibacillus sp. FSL W8-1187]|uniref:hypothetical protein n=1 Tax=Paenibacillus sp. FSL W8-1187 TaxID=2975339 RepID=UPI0030DB6EC1
MCRQWTYSGDMSALSAGFAIRQGQLAALGVRYVDRGWQAAVERLRGAAVQAGAVLAAGRAAERVLLRDGRVRGVSLADGSALEAAAVLMAAGPEEACRLVPGSARMSLGKWRGEARPLYAACLDIALKRPPCPERVFALGLDEPLYFSKHSGPVSLSDDGSAVFHAMKYNGTDGGSDAKADESRLTELLDLLEPGWDKEIAAMRFTPGVLVAHDSRPARRHGAGPAPGPAVPEVSGLFVAGDWVGADGRLADAAMASAKAAAEEILRRR